MTAEQFLAWQQDRRREDGQFHWPISGLGPDGQYCLWAPSPKVESKIVFSNGRPQQRVIRCQLPVRVNRLRDEVLASMTPMGDGRLSVDMRVIEYAAAILLLNYRLSDDELGMLLDGTTWHAAVVEHLMGGPEVVARLSELAPELLAPELLAPRQTFTDYPPPPRRPWWKRILGR
jgi:hypothetical protein